MKNYCIDIDGTICTNTDGNYDKAEPFVDRINEINTLHKEGNKIILFTARGTGTGINWRDVTEFQFKKWNVKYHELKLGKPIYDLFIDDKNANSEQFFNEN